MGIALSKSDFKIAKKVAYYYRYPERTSYCDKELIFEAIDKNKNIHFEALKINLKKWKKRKNKG